MKYSTVLFGSMFLSGLLAGADITVDETIGEVGQGQKRVFRFSAKTGPGEVLVVHSTRWEDGRKVLEFEEVRAAAGGATVTIAVFQPAPDCWQLSEEAIEQHVQGVALAGLKHTATRLSFELTPTPGGAKRRYAFQWDVGVENLEVIKQRFPDWPAGAPGTGQPLRRILFPVLPGKEE